MVRDLEIAYRDGRPSMKTIQRMQGILRQALEKWSIDLDDGVKSVTRQIEIPLLNKVVKIEGVTNPKVKFPVLWQRYKPLLFLNSLYRKRF